MHAALPGFGAVAKLSFYSVACGHAWKTAFSPPADNGADLCHAGQWSGGGIGFCFFVSFAFKSRTDAGFAPPRRSQRPVWPT